LNSIPNANTTTMSSASSASVEIEGGPRDGGHDDDLDHDDSDSQYTYESYSDDDESKKGRGWFGGFFGRRQSHHDGSEEDYSDDDGDGEEIYKGEEEFKMNEVDGEALTPRKEDAVDEGGNPGIKELAACQDEEEDKSEDKLMAEAILRVQNRIAANNGNLYNSLEPADKRLVDGLKGVTDAKVIEKAVEESFNIEDDEVETSVKTGKMAHEIDTPKEVGADACEKDDQPTAETPETDAVLLNVSVDTPPSPTALDTTDDLVYAGPPIRGVTTTDDPRNVATEVCSDEDEDEEPTLDEKRSLLGLAAEHDRVDVIKDLLNDSTDIVETLLAGTSAHRDDDGEDLPFSPPPLHIAVAHGSVNATACLLRMNADPSLRPTVPSRFLSSSYTPSKVSSRSNSGMSSEEDRNFKKYHELTAWELAFGGVRVIKDDLDDEADMAHVVMEESEPNQRKSWFGFGTPTKADEIIVTTETTSDGTTRVMKISPLNIPQTKLDGIKNAFSAEALRCIGSNEVARLRQLLDAGMEPSNLLIANKDFREWAIEVNAKDCVDLLDSMLGTEDQPESETDQFVDGRELSSEDTDAPQQQAVEAPVDDERLAGLSAGDMALLIQENSNLIPALQSCHDELLAETTLCKAILKDLSTTGGRGGLMSQSLLDLVRKLKDQRQQINDSTASWQAAWEEREDELDFFWEEVLDDELRDELGSALDQLKDPTDTINVDVESGKSLAQQFIEVDDRVNSLRELIAELAEESTSLANEIDSNGMSGALKLTRSLKEEIADSSKSLRVAQSGESICRAKLELIQRRLGHDQGGGEETGGHSNQPESHPDQPESHHTPATSADDMVDDHFVEEPLMHESSQESTQHVNDHQEPRHEGDYDESDDEDYVVGDDESSSGDDYTEEEYTDEEEGLEEEHYVVVAKDEPSMQDADVGENPPDEQPPSSDDVGGLSEPQLPLPKEKVKVSDQIERSNNKSNDPVGPAEFVHLPEQYQSRKPVAGVKHSEKIAKGVSTAIVAHSSSSIPISSQIWEIIRRIVGMSSSVRRSSSYLESENNPTIMTV